MKELDLKKSVYELTEQHPELIGILKELGFLGAANSIARNTLGRMTTIPQGVEKMGQDLKKVVAKLKDAGFEVRGGS